MLQASTTHFNFQEPKIKIICTNYFTMPILKVNVWSIWWNARACFVWYPHTMAFLIFLLYFHTLRTLKLHCRYGVSSLYHVKFAKICPECTFRLEHMRHDCRHISSYNIMHKRSEVCYITLVLHYKNVFQMWGVSHTSIQKVFYF